MRETMSISIKGTGPVSAEYQEPVSEDAEPVHHRRRDRAGLREEVSRRRTGGHQGRQQEQDADQAAHLNQRRPMGVERFFENGILVRVQNFETYFLGLG
jgi:hypothetical protein